MVLQQGASVTKCIHTHAVIWGCPKTDRTLYNVDTRPQALNTNVLRARAQAQPGCACGMWRTHGLHGPAGTEGGSGKAQEGKEAEG